MSGKEWNFLSIAKEQYMEAIADFIASKVEGAHAIGFLVNADADYVRFSCGEHFLEVSWSQFVEMSLSDLEELIRVGLSLKG